MAGVDAQRFFEGSPGFVEPERGGNSDIIGAKPRVDALAGPRITSTGGNEDDRIGAAEVARTPGASESFFLDPLLN